MTRVGDFQGIVQHSGGRVVVDDQGKVSTSSWKGSAVSFLKGNFKAENNRAKAAFVKSMKNAYGADVANQVALKLNMNDGKPLKMRQVKQLLADHVNIQRQPTPLQKGDVNLLLKANDLIKGGRLVLTEGDYSTLGNLSLSVSELPVDSPVLDQIVLASDEKLGQLVGECLKEAKPTPADIAKVVKAIRQGCPNYVTQNGNTVVVDKKVYTDPKVLAEGANGRAVRYSADDGTSIVVKYTLPGMGGDEEAIAKASNEVQVHRYANDGKGPGAQHVAKLIAPIRTHDNQIGIVLENCSLGDVKGYSKANGPLTKCLAKGLISPAVAEKVKLQMASDMLSGMAYLQNERNMLHLDIKPHNVFMNSSGELKIADFGEGASTMGLRTQYSTGTPMYMAPEMHAGKGMRTFDNKMDAYSVGVMVYELVTGTAPFFDGNPGVFDAQIAREEWFKAHTGVAEGAYATGNKTFDDLINGLTTKDRDNRIAMDEALNSPLFNSIKSNGEVFPELRQLAAAMVKRESLEKAVTEADSANKAAAQKALAELEAEISGLSLSVDLR